MKSKQLREKLAQLVADQRKALDTDGGMTAEIRTQVDAREKDITAVTADITLVEAQEARERELATIRNAPISGGENEGEAEQRKKQNEKEARQYSEAFAIYLRDGLENMSPEQRATLRKGYVPEKEGRAQSAVTGNAGGYTVPQGFMAELEKAMLHFGGVRQASRILKTDGGNAIPWPTVDDTGNTGEDVAENGPATETDAVFGQKVLNAYKLGSGKILIPTELFEDSVLNIEAEITALLGERLGRRQNAKFTNGTGASDFQGVVPAASLGKTAASATTLTTDELIDLQHSVDPAYRSNPKCAFMMNDDTIRIIRKLKDSNGRYILDITTVPGQPNTLLQKPLITNQDMATVATGVKSVLFGDFGKFIIRDVRNIVVRRLNELHAENDQVALLAWYRGDSRLVSASTKALKYLVQA